MNGASSAGRPEPEDMDLADLEVELLLEGLWRRYGSDFRDYERGRLRRLVHAYVRESGLANPVALLERVLHEPSASRALCRALLADDAGLFDDAAEFRALRQVIGSVLTSYPAPKIWIAECLSAEEVFSIAILLQEEACLDKAFIFATCSDEDVLQVIKQAAFPLDRIARYEACYRAAGGKGDFAQHYLVRDGRAHFADHLRARVIWAQYCLATDSSFNEFQLISCRNRLGDFKPPLQSRILGLFHQSLSTFGVLNLGNTAEIARPAHRLAYQALPQPGLYRRVGEAWSR